jgi:two-component system, OmpR family, response regulator
MKRLLIIDDEPAMARLIQRIAKSCGYEVTVTHDSEDFMDALVTGEPDAIALDLSLPDVDGVELLRFLATTKCRAKILIISGFDARVLETSGRLGEARGLNIAGTLMKPVRAAELRAAIEALDVAVAA